jgi:16S rRNA (adenine1518-N6/adenine1519-N6)-dimethyltransferase
MDAQAILAADVDPKARAETLSPQDYVRLARVVTS